MTTLRQSIIVGARIPSWGVELLATVAPIAALLVLWFLWLLIRRRPWVTNVMRESMNPHILPLDRRWLQSGWAAIVLAFVSITWEKILLRSALPDALRLLTMLAPAPALIWFIITWRREVFKGDELDRRIHLNALSMAFPAFVVMMVLFRLLDGVNWPNPPVSLRWQFLLLLYGSGIWMSKFWYAGPDAALREAAGRPSLGGDDREQSRPNHEDQ